MIWNSEVPMGSAWWQWGSRRIWVCSDPGEVRVGTEGGETAVSDVELAQVAGPEPSDVSRYARGGKRSLRWTARTADRSVVVRPAVPLAVLGDAHADIFVSTPLWIGLQHDGADEPFFEVPTNRPSNTWFGVTPQAGELAYASRSRARSTLSEDAFVPGRAMTRVRLINRSSEPWHIERLKVPVPHLALFHSEASGVWTSDVEVTCTRADEADVFVSKQPPERAHSAVLFREPRDGGTPRLVMRALGSLGWN